MINIPKINENLARLAHYGTSFVPEQRGVQEVSYFERHAQAFVEKATKAVLEPMTDLKEQAIQEALDNMAALFNVYLTRKSRCISPMIVGPARFPVERNKKLMDAEHNALVVFDNYAETATKRLKKRFGIPDMIMSGASDAVERLRQKLAEEESLQLRYKKINRAHAMFLKNPDSNWHDGLTESEQKTVKEYMPRYSWEPHPIAPYMLTNLSARIRQTKKRLESVTVQKQTEAKAYECASGIRVEECPPDNRIRVFFPSKPDYDVRFQLKSHGFRWTPSLGCWQAYLNNRSIQYAHGLVETKK